MQRRVLNAGLVLVVLAFVATPALARLDPYDPPTLSCEGSAESALTLMICAGATGTPAGLTLQWKKLSDWEANGWDDVGDLCRLSLSGQPSLMHPGKSRWELMPGECEGVRIGDILFDETGVSGEGCALNYLECGTQYVFRAFSHAGRGMGRSDWSQDLVCSTLPCPPVDCTHSWGYWQTHGPDGCRTGNNANEWPAVVLANGLTIGNPASPSGCFRNPYTAAQLCAMLNMVPNQPGCPACTPQNKLLPLLRQLIAAKLNVASGAVCEQANVWIAAADLKIANRCVPPLGNAQLLTNDVETLIMQLESFNTGGMAGCPDDCSEGVAQQLDGVADGVKLPWGALKIRYR